MTFAKSSSLPSAPFDRMSLTIRRRIGNPSSKKGPEGTGAWRDSFRRKRMMPSPPASAFGGSVGKNAMLKEESVSLPRLELLLRELLREAERQASRAAGEQRFDECARLHA